MKKYLITLLSLSFILCGCNRKQIAPAPTSATSVETPAAIPAEVAPQWSVQLTVDEFGDITGSSTDVLRIPITGTFSNTATTDSTLTGYAFMQLHGKQVVFMLRLLEYGDHPATYTAYDPMSFKIKVDDLITDFSAVYGQAPNSDLIIQDTSEALYTALYDGKQVRCIATVGSSKYNFTLSGENFAQACQQTGYITQRIYFRDTDNAVLYQEATDHTSQGNYSEATEILTYLQSQDYPGATDLALEIAVQANYYGVHDMYTQWKNHFDPQAVQPLTGEQIQSLVVGNWYYKGDVQTVYYENGDYSYRGSTGFVWFVENDRLIVESEYTRSEYILYPFYKNSYVFCAPRAYNKVTSDVYELKFLGPLE